MDDIRSGLIEEFGNSYVRFGHTDLMGRVMGLMMFLAEPVTVEQIAKILGATKSPVNAICKRLEELSLIRKAFVKGDRRFHYKIVDNPFMQATRNLSKMNEGNLQLARRQLKKVSERLNDAASSEERQQLETIARRLILMHEFYQHLIEMYEQLVDRWKFDREQLPDIDEFLKAHQ